MKAQVMMLGVGIWAALLVLQAPALAEDDPLRVELSEAVHFLDATGSTLIVPPGVYRVEPRDASLALTPEDGRPALLIAAAIGAHEESIAAPLALSIPVGPDEHHLVYLRPGGTTLDAKGSPSGVHSRGPELITATRLKKYSDAVILSGTSTKPCSVSTRPTSIVIPQPVPPTHYVTVSPLTLASSLLFNNMKTNTGAPITLSAVDEQSNILGTMLTITAPSGTYVTRLTAPVHLPDGAIIREIAVLVHDVLDEDIEVGLLGHRLSLGASTMGSPPAPDSLINVYLKSECASWLSNRLLTANNLAIPVVNRDRGYLVYVFMTAKPTPGHKISPIRIGYTLQ